MMAYLVLIKLIFAHLLVDFCFQPTSFVQKKREGKQIFQILHALMHALLAYLLVGYWQAWYIPLLIGVTHYGIDLWKSKQKETIAYFIIDQLLHLVVIIFLWLFVTKQVAIAWEEVKGLFENQAFWVYLGSFILILKPTSIFLSVATKKWEEGRGKDGLTNAGQWIGYLERTLILIFICISVYEAIGFILAAKSIYRFGELKDASDIKKTEYIMIGTFLSFTVAIIVGMLMKSLIS